MSNPDVDRRYTADYGETPDNITRWTENPYQALKITAPAAKHRGTKCSSAPCALSEDVPVGKTFEDRSHLHTSNLGVGTCVIWEQRHHKV